LHSELLQGWRNWERGGLLFVRSSSEHRRERLRSNCSLGKSLLFRCEFGIGGCGCSTKLSQGFAVVGVGDGLRGAHLIPFPLFAVIIAAGVILMVFCS